MIATLERARDVDIARRARTALSARLGYVGEGLELAVREGIVDLAGEVETGNQKTIAETCVGELAGVGSVENHLRIVPPSKLAMRTFHL